MNDIRLCAVFGDPIDHSLSPIIHETFARQCGISLKYEKHRVSKDSFGKAVSAFFASGGWGLNITLPLKELAYQLADQSMPAAAKAKAANTLWMHDSELIADNTDGQGLVIDLSHYMALANKRVHILGAGGAARGIIQPLLDAGVQSLSLSNRTLERALALQSDYSRIHIFPWQDSLPDIDLLINTTSAAYSSKPIIWPTCSMKSLQLAYDLAYSQTQATPFVQHYRNIAEHTADGLGMLIEQAALSFERWHHTRPDTMPIREDWIHR